MISNKRKFSRSINTRASVKYFIISAEGSKTEPQYFTIFSHPHFKIRLLPCKDNSAPENVLKRMIRHLKENEYDDYEAWLIVDKDQRDDEEFINLRKWSKENKHGMAISDPMFEYWLLLHFEDGEAIKSAQDCIDRLKKHTKIKDYDKNINRELYTIDRIKTAVERAKKRDISLSRNDTKCLGFTTVYKVVENILACMSPNLK